MWRGVHAGGLAVQIVMWRSRESISISRSGSLIPFETAVAGVAAGSIKVAEDEEFN